MKKKLNEEKSEDLPDLWQCSDGGFEVGEVVIGGGGVKRSRGHWRKVLEVVENSAREFQESGGGLIGYDEAGEEIDGVCVLDCL